MSSESDPPSAQGWLALPRCRVGGQLLPMVLLHPRLGIAVEGGPPEAAALVRHRLERARFPAIFPGHLPVARIEPGQDPASGFDPKAALDLPGGDAWIACARRALERDAPQGEVVPLPARRRRHRRARRLAVAAGLAALLIGGVALSVLEARPAQSSHAATPIR
jgi:hypothetical protein